jgi:histidine triad (HIT) family protein
MSDCIFCKIARGEIPCKKIYEDDDFLAFHDIHPQRPVHFLLIPKGHIATLYDAGPEHEAVLGRMLARAGSLAREQGLGDGFRTIINTGKVGGQEVYHLHLHVLGGPLPVGPMVSK